LGACQSDEWGALHGESVDDDDEITFTAEEWEIIADLSPPSPLPEDPTNAWADDEAAASLGQRLFFEESYAGTFGTPDHDAVSCASCHDPSDWFQESTNLEAGETLDERNIPTIVNAAHYEWFSWDGRRDSLWAQTLLPTEGGPLQSDRGTVARMLFSKYRLEYEGIFGPMPDALDPNHPEAARFPVPAKPLARGGAGAWETMTAADQDSINRIFANFGKALAAYQRKIVTGRAPFDDFVGGDPDAIGQTAKRGLRLFVGEAGCVRCHSGPTFSDDGFHNIGLAEVEGARPHGRLLAIGEVLADEFNTAGVYSDEDVGKLTGLVATEADRGRFRTKHLRGVTRTGGYMHAAQLNTTADVVRFYRAGGDDRPHGELDERIQPLDLSDDDVLALTMFLETLNPKDPIPEALRENTARP
jgi:cytochrome c peroxidase